jgi:phage/plasmid-associated DNA primase
MIEGCLDSQKNGLIRPGIVAQATAEYFSEQNIVSAWVEDCCNVGAGQFDTTADLFKSWTAHCLANGQKTTTSMWFSQTLTRLGYEALKNTPGKMAAVDFALSSSSQSTRTIGPNPMPPIEEQGRAARAAKGACPVSTLHTCARGCSV